MSPCNKIKKVDPNECININGKVPSPRAVVNFLEDMVYRCENDLPSVPMEKYFL